MHAGLVMARIARVVVPGIPHHVTQRGNRKQQTFFGAADYRAYIRMLAKEKAKARAEVWAYCLMPNHVHFVVVPAQENSLALMFKETHRKYTRRVNSREGWCGHLWQERFHSFPMDESHLLAAVRYVELNPVRAGLCSAPADWRWSSLHAHCRGEDDVLVHVRPMLARIKDWHRYLGQTDAESLLDKFRRHSRTGRPAGDDHFVSRLERMTGRTLIKRKPGRSSSN
jgi:putative transposase